MEELLIDLDGEHKCGCKTHGETFKAGQRNISLLSYKRACDGASVKHSTTVELK